MVPAALPLTKIATLFVKTLAKPVSKRIKHEFSKNATTASGLVWIGQTSHQITSRLTIWSAGYKVRTVQPLNDVDALKVGSEFVGESFILGVSVAAVVWEYNRSKEKERDKEQKLHNAATQERQQLHSSLQQLDRRLHTLEVIVQNNYTIIQQLQKDKQQQQQQEQQQQQHEQQQIQFDDKNSTTVEPQRRKWIFF